MVKSFSRVASVALLAWVGMTPLARALLPQTQADLRVLEDRLSYEFGEVKVGRPAVAPVLVATPQPYWAESRADFSAAVYESLRRAFKEPGDLIPCPECAQSRTFVSRDNRTVVQSGEIGPADLARLRENPAYARARTLMIIRETPGGVEIRALAIDDGRILYAGLADSTKTLADAEPPLRLAREMERRKRGEALGYVHFDLGLLPGQVVQFKWLEQWGDRNQNLSGLALGILNPTLSIGAAHFFMWPRNRRILFGVAGFYGVAAALDSSSDAKAGAFALQGSVTYAFNGAYGVFASVNTQGVISVGLSLLNPVLFPFLL